MKNANTGTDFEALAAMKDEDIDCSDIPELTQEELHSPEWFVEGPGRETIYLSFDHTVLDFFRKTGRNYRERMNEVLMDYVRAAAQAG